jgi:uncharacterized protein YcfJ
MKIRNVIAASVIALMVSGCQTSTIGTVAGGLLGVAAGAYGGSQFGDGLGQKIATAGGGLLGGLLGGGVGHTAGLVYDNSAMLDQQGNAIYQLNQEMKQNQRGASSIFMMNGGQGAPQYDNPPTPRAYDCRIQNNYVVCDGRLQ